MSIDTSIGVNGLQGDTGLSGAAGGGAVATPLMNGDSYNTADANAGAGGGGGVAGGNGVAGSGGAGGAATAAVKTVAPNPLGANAVAMGYGGAGGKAGMPGDPTTQGATGGAGGTSTASASDTNLTGAAIATAQAIGGNGGNGQGVGAGGAAGIAKATKASAFGLGAATALVTQTGGDGGGGGAYGSQSIGAAGGATTLRNAVTGSTLGGLLTLTQIARGGTGGTSQTATPGVGGKASSTLIFDDTTQVVANRSSSVEATILAYGGDGGAGNANFGGASGGAGAATVSITGAGAVQADAEAYGGSEGAVFFPTVPHGGGATAQATGVGRFVTVTAYAWGGTGQVGGGVATATAEGVGAGGSVTSKSVTSRISSGLITMLSAATSAPVAGTSRAYTYAHLGGVGPTSMSGDQGVAAVVGAPSPTGVGPVLSLNPNLKSGFGAKPLFFANAELAGGYSTTAGAAEVSISEIEMTVNLSLTPKNQDLLIGLHDPVATGAGFTSLSFDVTANGTNILHRAFGSLIDAKAYFSDHAVDTGWSPTSGPGGASGSAQIGIILSMTTASPGDGFTVNLLVGDSQPLAITVAGMASAMAAMGASSSAGLVVFSDARPADAPALSLACTGSFRAA